MKLYSVIFAATLLLCTAFSDKNIEEEAYLHLNSTTLLSGETLLFSAFVYSKTTNNPSPLSTVLYVELVNEKGVIAHQSKVSMIDGRGYGDIFISSNISSGTYQLLAYTRWMKNFKQYYECPIIIINPFEKVNVADQNVSTELNLEFKSSKNGIINGLQNELIYTVSGINAAATYKGKIVNSDGEPVAEFKANANSLGKIDFTPKNTHKHQVILEDEQGKFYFFDLPSISDQGSIIALEESSVSFSLKTLSSISDMEGKLIVKGKSRQILNQTVVNNSLVVLPKRDLSQGLYQAYLISINGDTLANRVFCYLTPETKDIQENFRPVFKQRDLVQLEENLPNGRYSVSVRKVREVLKDTNPSIVDYSQWLYGLDQYYQLDYSTNHDQINLQLSQVSSKTQNDNYSIKYLPDYRGELIEGSVLGLKNTHIAYSTIGTNQLSVSTIDSLSNFVINIQSSGEDQEAYLSTFESGGHEIRLSNQFLTQRPSFNPPQWPIDSMGIKELIQSSINSQIENAYFETKKDSIFTADKLRESFYVYEYLYLLDDYNRFKTLKETFIEYIPAIGVRKRNGVTYFKVRTGEYTPEFDEDALVLLDGIVVDAESILKFSPFKVKSIGIVNKRVYVGSKIFDGLISFHSFDQDLHDFNVNSNYLKFNMTAIQPKKIYAFPDYSNKESDRIPDKREQLFWMPLINHTDESYKIEFYTSDIKGKFEISIEGMTTDGKPMSIRKTFEVQ